MTGNIIVILIVLALVIGALLLMFKNKKEGKGCAGCSGSCHCDHEKDCHS